MIDQDKLLLEIYGKVKSIETSINDIKQDLNIQMSKIEVNESRILNESLKRSEAVQSLRKYIYMVTGAMGLATFCITILGMLFKAGII